MENKTRNKGESIAALIFGIIWFAMSVLILVLYNSGESLQELPIPRMLMFFL